MGAGIRFMKLLQQLHLPGLLVSASILSIASVNAQENAVYTVQSGDTPCEIAEFFRVPCAALIDENDLGADPIIYAGQILKVPLLGTADTNTDNTIAQTQTQAQIQDTSPVEVTAVAAASTDDTATINFADLVTVYQLAKASDPVFAAEGYRHDAAAEILPQSRAALRPQLTAAGALTSASTDSLDTTSASVGLSQTLYNRASSVAVKQADQQTAQAALVFAVATESLITRTVNAYFSVLAMQDNVELSLSNQRAIGRQLELAEQRLEVGLGTRTDLFDARARYENAVADAIEAEKLLDDARQVLIALIGEDVGELHPLAKSAQLIPPQPDDPEQWVARALSDNRTLKAKSLGISFSSLEIDRQKAQRLPGVGLQLSGNYSDTVSGDDTSARITLSVNIPFYQGGLVNARVREAAENRNAARSDYEAASRDIRRDTRQTFLGIKSRLRRVAALAEAVRAGENALLGKEESFAAGLTTNIAVLDAQRDLFRAERNYTKGRYEYIMQMLQLERLSGDLDENDVSRANAWLTGHN